MENLYRVDLTSRNTHDIIFRIIEIGVALWFPCVLWNCIRPEQLWCLNPKKILDRGKKFKSQFNNGAKRNDDVCDRKRGRRSSDSDMKGDHQLQRDSRETSSTDFSTSDDGTIIYMCNTLYYVFIIDSPYNLP